MTTATMQTTAHPQRTAPGFGSVLASEWVKLRSVRATYIQIGLAIVLAIGLSGLISLAIGSSFDQLNPQDQADFEPISAALFGGGLASIVLIVMGVQFVSSEYTSGMIRLSVTTTPQRSRVLLAKAIIITVVTLAIGLVMTVGAFVVSQAVLGQYEGVPTASLSDSDSQLAMLAIWLTTPMWPLLGAALGAILRSTASAITTTLGLLFVPGIFGGLLPDWLQKDVLAYLPGNAGDSLVLANSNTESLTRLDWPVAIVVAVAWVVAFFAVALVLMKRRDV
jgi:ABC-type transport system involved in multi-copper enzyme maturation permease subunit